jgi:hypothetical protein
MPVVGAVVRQLENEAVVLCRTCAALAALDLPLPTQML